MLDIAGKKREYQPRRRTVNTDFNRFKGTHNSLTMRNNLTIRGNSAKSKRTRETSRKGVYEYETHRSFQDMTEKDIELRYEYAKDFIHGYLHLPSDMIILEAVKDKEDNTTLSSKFEVFFVIVGEVVIGKVSIQTQRLLHTTILTFILSLREGIRNIAKGKKSDGF